MYFNVSMRDTTNKTFKTDLVTVYSDTNEFNELKREVLEYNEKLKYIIVSPNVYLNGEDLIVLATLVSYLRITFPGTNIELDLADADVPKIGLMNKDSRIRFKVMADIINTMNFDKVTLPPAPREVLKMIRGNVSMVGFLERSDWAPDPKNFDAVCYTCAEDHRINVCVSDPSIFATQSPLTVCAVGFNGAVADDCVVTTVDNIPQYLGYNYDTVKPVILTAKGESLKDRRVLMLARDTLEITPFISIAKRLKEAGAEYVGLYSVQSEENTTSIHYRNLEQDNPGSTFIDYIFVEKEYQEID